MLASVALLPKDKTYSDNELLAKLRRKKWSENLRIDLRLRGWMREYDAWGLEARWVHKSNDEWFEEGGG